MTTYTRIILFTAGMGGLLYGIDIGIISAALLYLNKTIDLSEQQTSVIVAAVLGGSMASSLVAGMLADYFGRKKMLVVSALIFVSSVGLIVLSQGFIPLFLGRLLQGMSGGVIAVVVPLYLAECLSPETRGKGTAIFQLMLTFGIVAAALVGLYYSRQAESASAAAAGNAVLITEIQSHAWRSMFFSIIYPGLIFFAATFFVRESPRWLFRKGKSAEALEVLCLSCPPGEAQREILEMIALREAQLSRQPGSREPLFQRKYVVPFVLACVILGCTQATGINSILQFLVVILKQAGMSAVVATQGDVAVKILNCAITFVAMTLVDKRGRKFLLKIGTSGIAVALLLSAVIFHGVESRRIDVREQVQAAVANDSLSLPVTPATFGASTPDQAKCLTILYTYGDGDKVATVLSNDPNPKLTIAPPPNRKSPDPLQIKRAQFGPVPSENVGWLVAILMGLFVASFSIGPGVCVWLALSELMPTRIRSVGMGVALLVNQGVSTAIAAVFLPTVGHYGYTAMFLFWAVCSIAFFLVVTFFLPETKGKTLEEIEEYFART